MTPGGRHLARIRVGLDVSFVTPAPGRPIDHQPDPRRVGTA
ncbi:hypothetical protein [uncultured Sphingomonas sp.]